MNNDSKMPYPLKSAALTLLPLVAAFGLTGCGGGGSDTFNAPEPTKPPKYQSDNSGEMSGLVTYYDFEFSLADASNQFLDAEVIGHTTEFTDLGNIAYDGSDGIHPLSTAAVFDGISGLLLPGNVFTGPSYTVSMWVKPSLGNTGPLFYAASAKGGLLLNNDGLTVFGPETGHGSAGHESVTYTSPDFSIPSNIWSHVAFTVDKGLPNIYINGLRVYEGGDLTKSKYTFDDGFIMEADNFNDLFSGTYNTIALGVTNSDADKPFKGKIDNLRIFNYALYHGNITVLSREVTNEGPAASIAATFAAPDINVSWNIERFPLDTITLNRETFGADAVVIAESLPGTSTAYTDASVPRGENYRYTLTAKDTKGHTYTSEASDYVRVPGDAPYAAVTAELNEDENIELSLYTENLNVTSYDVKRGFDQNYDTSETIATGLTATTYIDLKDDDSPLTSGTPYFYWVDVTDASPDIVTSLALPSASATAAGEFVPTGTFILEELTDGYCGADKPSDLESAIEDINPGFLGAGYINTLNAVGASAYWRVFSENGGTYNFTVRYALGSNAEDNRWGRLTGNNDVLVEQVNMTFTGAFTIWVSESYVISLAAGVTDLKLEAGTAGGLANLDSLTLEALEESSPVTGVPCAN